MNLPEVITALINAQASFDSVQYAKCFSDTAVVLDESEEHEGRESIQKWFASTSEKYQSVLKPFAYTGNGDNGMLTSEVSGTFPGSPIVLKFHFTFANELIEKLEIKS
jgi:hypothetical protein